MQSSMSVESQTSVSLFTAILILLVGLAICLVQVADEDPARAMAIRIGDEVPDDRQGKVAVDFIHLLGDDEQRAPAKAKAAPPEKAVANAKPRQTERDLQKKLEKEMEAEGSVRLWDGTVADLVTNTHVIEIDWAHNFYEAFGQAQYYTLAYKRTFADRPFIQPAVVLLVRDKEKEKHFLYRAQSLSQDTHVELIIKYVDDLEGE